MKISYAITVCNELNEITKLLNFLLKHRVKEDEIVILFDKKNGTPEVWSRLQELRDESSDADFRSEPLRFVSHGVLGIGKSEVLCWIRHLFEEVFFAS